MFTGLDTMRALCPSDRSRLAAVLGLLGSDHAGERDAAALAASRMLRAARLTWHEVLQDEPTTHGPSLDAPGRDDHEICLRHLAHLTDWEQDFVLTLARRPRRSPKQLAVLCRLAGTLRARGLC